MFYTAVTPCGKIQLDKEQVAQESGSLMALIFAL
jgi:hypothetical protein